VKPPGPLQPWPPMIGTAHQPAWIRVRDVLLTVLAWLALGWMLATPLALAWDFFFVGPVFAFSRHEPVDWRGKWLLLRPFAIAAALLVVWILFWALLRTRALAARSAQPAPASLALADHAARWALEPQAVQTWRAPKVALARFDDAQRLVAVEGVELPRTSDSGNRSV
jgi:poly-beta-1,6-N-acetyl-D-glucosamine biosynthesis protein PgaD